MNTFKDNFSKQAEVYLKFRPTYPQELFEFLSSLTSEQKLAWDCGTGNGQSAVKLADYYEKVYATDPSVEQIKNAIHHDRVTYKVENAETPSSLEDNSVDLITVAQAIHWFDFDKFYTQVRRVSKPNGIIAVWAYGTPTINEELNNIIKDFHDNIVGEFWLPENKLIDMEYSTIPFPFQELKTPEFFIRKQVTLSETLGHLRSWSATQKYIDKYDINPIDTLSKKMQEYWKDTDNQKEMTWKIILKVGKIVSR
ncbi:ubiquinone/menaquinone biosynthesis C-methylase UbiE [Chryseobacterium ginsenosidimutans]|uniref:class I SAM-dependent methyltransferase n=1 Tax=Chryseobacterium ginsenosidimutans TaxID=687846 RepID=UPI00278B3D5A|nr:class I SAM-dependent methyltransferase [Chryseobacterium ginsenosidimutans]MDQ0594387.1 ubiquinone/menaquinone biosynthesis C-methylase UbiE [Chryseobacterium ginsenosidimutans]